jgi:hypothetical protein
VLAAGLDGCVTVKEEVVATRLRSGLGDLSGSSDAAPRRELKRQPAGERGAAPESVPELPAVLPPPEDDGSVAESSGPPVADFTAGRVRVGVLARGTIPYDRLSLPIVSSRGRFVATQTGLPPAWPILLAQPGGGAARGTSVEVFAVPDDPTAPLVPMAKIPGPILLGRGATPNGVLLEEPKRDGGRRIGLADWETGLVRWLIDRPNAVCAFAAAGPGERMAWSQRPQSGARFALHVRGPLGEFDLPADGGDWLLPVYASDGEGLFVLRLEEGRLDLVHMTVTDAKTARATRRSVTLQETGATVELAFHVMSATPSWLRGTSADARIGFFHPAERCAAIWAPGQEPVLLDPGSYAAVLDPDDPGAVLMVSTEGLYHCRIDDLRRRTRLLPGTQVPRPTDAPDRPWLVLGPEHRTVQVTLMQILPAPGSGQLGTASTGK